MDALASAPALDADRLSHRLLAERFKAIRSHTEALCSHLSDEDQCVQSMPDASPTKWHRAHTTWFFEQFILVPHAQDYRPFDPAYAFLFNSYYEAVGARHPRPKRGLLTRPPAHAIGAYRSHVDAAMLQALPHLPTAALTLLELGLNHEQQHQELLVTDTLHLFAENPLAPAMLPDWRPPTPDAGEPEFVRIPRQVSLMGHAGGDFCFDNETPRHEVLVGDYQIASHLVRNGAWLSFIEDGGYDRVSLWMSEGWAAAQAGGWQSPLHWRKQDGRWWQFGPDGLRMLDLGEPVRHISWYEADAFARWAGSRLPTETEWEVAHDHGALREVTAHVWQWTASAYAAYPRFRPEPGAVGEYNGKFMINQMVLRGGSMATPDNHTRPTYRNFFHPDKRWQFSGLRLARDL